MYEWLIGVPKLPWDEMYSGWSFSQQTEETNIFLEKLELVATLSFNQ
jgi:hypothetical protein